MVLSDVTDKKENDYQNWSLKPESQTRRVPILELKTYKMNELNIFKPRVQTM